MISHFDFQNLPFDQFEAFVRALLNARPVIPIKIGEEETHLYRHDLVHRYGKQGDAQRGIDLLGVLAGGDQIVFQCKYHSPDSGRHRVSKIQAESAITLAHSKYPEAKYFVLITNTSFTTGAIDSLAKADWLKWGGEQLQDLIRALPIGTGYRLVLDHFGKPEADRMYPHGPDLLVSPQDYQAARDDALAHKYACVGREQEIEALIAALTDKPRRAVLLSGDGGLGKSRIFCEVLNRLSEKWTTLILQPEIREASARQVALLETDRLIVGMDECHLDGFFREDVSLAVKRNSSNGRLFLVCRPEALPKLRQRLRTQGWEFVEPLHNSGGLQMLNKESMYKLAAAVLGENNQQSRTLAELSSGNPLITVVGGEMLLETKTSIPSLIRSPDFRRKVFEHLEDSYLRLIDQHSHRQSRRLLRLLAILSPCDKEQFLAAASLLEIGELAFQDEIDRLKRSGLIRGSNEHLRVIPDLFSDYLVQDALVDSNDFGILPRLISSELITKGGVAVFRNLAMARWSCGSDSQHLDPIMQKLWESYKNRFRNGHDQERSDLLSSWRKWALYLPEESLEFTKLALESESNPEPNPLFGSLPSYSSFLLKEIHAEAIRILSDLAKFHPDYQSRALTLAWKHRDKEPGNSQRNAPGPIAQIFGPKIGRSPESSRSALVWLQAEVAKSPTFEAWTKSCTNELAYFLQPAFTPFLEDHYSVGNTAFLGSHPISIERTAALRQLGMEIIEKIGLTSILGALNCLTILKTIAWPAHPPFGGKASADWLSTWEGIRLSALELLLKISRHHDEELLRFLVRANVLDLKAIPDQPTEFYGLCEAILQSIPESSGLNLARVLLSDEDTEFSLPYSDWNFRENRDQIREDWNSLCGKAANDLMASVLSGETLGEKCEDIAQRMVDHGLQPRFFSLFDWISRTAPDEIEGLRNFILDHPDCGFSSNYHQLATLPRDPRTHDQHLAEGVTLQRPNLFQVICQHLQRHDEDTNYSATRIAIAHACREASAEEIAVMLRSLQPNWLTSVNTLLLENLPWNHVSEGHLEAIAKTFDMQFRGSKAFPPSILPRILKRLNQLPMEAIANVSEIVSLACHDMPDAAFAFFEERMERARHESVPDDQPVFPYFLERRLRFSDPIKIADYEDRVGRIFTALKSNPESQLQREWFQIAGVNTSRHGIELLRNWITSLTSLEDLNCATMLITGSRPRLALSDPPLVKTLLTKAQSFSDATFRDIERDLFVSVVGHGQSYFNGIPQDQIVLNEARKLREQYNDDPVLHRLYDRVVRHEEADEEKNRDFYQKSAEMSECLYRLRD